MDGVLLQQRKPTGCWVASTRASPADKDYCPTPLSLSYLEYYVQFWSLLCKKSCEQVGEGLEKGHRDDQRTRKLAK